MPSQFFGLTIGYSGLTNYQAALNTTGNNIANVKTKGYSRQVVNQTAANALRTYTSYGMAGAGVTTKSIDQLRNAYYDIKYWNNNANVGEYSVKADYMKQIENYFNDDGETILGFNNIYNTIFQDALSELQKNPSDSSFRSNFVGAAKSLTEYFNSMAEQLTQLQKDANEEIKDKVDEISTIGSQIATLNKQINIIELKGVTANELRDQRNLLVDQLSKIVDVTIDETDIYNPNDPDNPTGAKRYTVTIAGGNTLVDMYNYRTMECVSRDVGNEVNQSDAEGLYDIFWTDTGVQFNPYGKSLSGELKSLIEVRDGNNEEYFNGKLLKSEAASYTAQTATDPATITVNVTDDYLKDLTKCTLNETGIITVNNLPYKFSGWETVTNALGEITGYKFTLKKDSEQDHATSNIGTALAANDLNVAIGKKVDYEGVPYYQEQMNEWVRDFAEIFNDTMEKGEDAYGNAMAGTAFFIAQNPTDSTSDYNFNGTGNVSSTSDSYYMLTAASFGVNTAIQSDVGLIATTSTDGDIDSDNSDIVKELSNIFTDKEMMNFRGCSSSEFLTCILSDVALNAGSANNFLKNTENIEKAIANQRLSVSGVDNDEEALDLVKFQNAYNLNSKMVQVMTEIYDRLILQTGV